MYTHKITDTYQTDAGVISSVISTYTGDTEVGFDGVIAANTTNQSIDVNAKKTLIQSLLLTSNVAVSILTNSSSSPTQTITLAAGQQINWGTDHTEANPITADIVTGMFITNATTGPATVKIRFLMNP
jgi:hypothetical protein